MVDREVDGQHVFVLCLLHFRLMVDREVDVPVWLVLGRSCGLCWRSWAALGAYAGGLGPLLGLTLSVLGPSWGLCGRSWAALGAYVGGLVRLLGPMLAVLGCSQALCRRSWERIRA